MNIKSFEKSGYFSEGYSDYWRRNKSVFEAVELANILRALRKVAGHIGMNVGTVEWTTMSEPDPHRSIIALDPSFVLGNYPVPPGKMDILVGLVVHQTLRQREWSELVWKKTGDMCRDVTLMDRDLLWGLVDTGEDIYVDKLAERNVFGIYVAKVREIIRAKGQPTLVELPSAKVLFALWWQSVLDDQKPDKLNPQYNEPLNFLASHTQDLVDIGNKKASVIEKCQLRSELYLKIWESLKPLISDWQQKPRAYFTEPAEVQKVTKTTKKKKGIAPAESAIPPELANQIEALLAVGTPDMTPLIQQICGTDNPDVISTSLRDFNIPANPVVDLHLVARLKGLFQRYGERIQVKSRGLKSGSIDRRRLYRASIRGDCFMIKQMIPEEAWNITVLVDASWSMAGQKWQLIESTVAALAKSLHGGNNKLQALGYFEHDGVCIISNILKQGKIYSIPPHGQTPSGQAIIAAALLMPKERKHKFLIHITDGESNCGCSVDYAIDFCQKRKIDLVTLGCGYRDKDILIKQYGNSLQFLDYFDQLPHAIEVLLKRRLLYRNFPLLQKVR